MRFFLLLLALFPLTLSASSSDLLRTAFEDDLLNTFSTLADKPAHNLFVVVIDPGHGGKDSGAKGSCGTEEKNVVLSIAKQLAAKINHTTNMRAILTRNGDYFIALRERLAIARKNNADLFISLHADSYFNSEAKGASVYALSKRGATSEAARWLARRENYSELGTVALNHLPDKSLALRSMLIDLAQTSTIRESLQLGYAVLHALNQITVLHHEEVEQAPFVVLKSPDIPSLLIEVGFISNSDEEKRLSNREDQVKIAEAIFAGLI